MSKPICTNSPRASKKEKKRSDKSESLEFSFKDIAVGGVKSTHRTKKKLGGYSGEDPPLPIPNREVKLACADGTATPCGRVGSRRLQKGLSADAGRLFFLKPAAFRRL